MIPAAYRRRCLFKESCSRHVYKITRSEGLGSGWLAFKKRYQQCRPGYKIFYNTKKGAPEMELANHDIIDIDEIREEIIQEFRVDI